MTVAYVDTSAAMKLVIEEPESEALIDLLSTDRDLVSSWLLHTELHCAAGRHADLVDAETVHGVLAVMNLADLTRGDLIAASAHHPLRSHDAIHLAVAIRLGVDEVVTYDRELALAAGAIGMAVAAPGS